MGHLGRVAGVLFGLVATGLFLLAACSGAVAPVAPQEKPASDEVDAACPRPVLTFRDASPSVRCGDHVCEGAKPVCCGQGLRGDAMPEEPVCAASRDACQFRQPGSVVVCDDDEDCPDACCQEGSLKGGYYSACCYRPVTCKTHCDCPFNWGCLRGACQQ